MRGLIWMPSATACLQQVMAPKAGNHGQHASVGTHDLWL